MTEFKLNRTLDWTTNGETIVVLLRHIAYLRKTLETIEGDSHELLIKLRAKRALSVSLKAD